MPMILATANTPAPKLEQNNLASRLWFPGRNLHGIQPRGKRLQNRRVIKEAILNYVHVLAAGFLLAEINCLENFLFTIAPNFSFPTARSELLFTRRFSAKLIFQNVEMLVRNRLRLSVKSSVTKRVATMRILVKDNYNTIHLLKRWVGGNN